jgi:hypothetical protein
VEVVLRPDVDAQLVEAADRDDGLRIEDAVPPPM